MFTCQEDKIFAVRVHSLKFSSDCQRCRGRSPHTKPVPVQRHQLMFRGEASAQPSEGGVCPGPSRELLRHGGTALIHNVFLPLSFRSSDFSPKLSMQQSDNKGSTPKCPLASSAAKSSLFPRAFSVWVFLKAELAKSA